MERVGRLGWAPRRAGEGDGGSGNAMVTILQGDCRTVLPTLPAESVHCVVTSPPYYGLRDYGVDGQIGLEATPEAYVAELVAVFREVRRVLREDGTLWLNLGDSYTGYWGKKYAHKPFGADRTPDASTPPHKDTPDWWAMGLKPKELLGIPWRVAFALQSDGWWLRSDIIWHKPNPMPESVTDRCTKAHEYLFLMTKSARYWYDAEAIKEAAEAAGQIPGGNHKVDESRNDAARDMTIPVASTRNRRSVWTIATHPYAEAHFATFPPALVTPCVLAGCPQGGTVLDPFGGSGTVGEVAEANGRNSILIELNGKYVEMAKRRTAQTGLFATHARAPVAMEAR